MGLRLTVELMLSAHRTVGASSGDERDVVIREVVSLRGLGQRDVHGVVGVLDHLHIDVGGDLSAVFGQDGLRVREKARLQGVVLPAGGDQFGKCIARVARSWRAPPPDEVSRIPGSEGHRKNKLHFPWLPP